MKSFCRLQKNMLWLYNYILATNIPYSQDVWNWNVRINYVLKFTPKAPSWQSLMKKGSAFSPFWRSNFGVSRVRTLHQAYTSAEVSYQKNGDLFIKAPNLSTLAYRNTLIENVGSLAQILITEDLDILYQPQTNNGKQNASTWIQQQKFPQKTKSKQKQFYDRKAKPMERLNNEDTVRSQLEKGGKWVFSFIQWLTSLSVFWMKVVDQRTIFWSVTVITPANGGKNHLC